MFSVYIQAFDTALSQFGIPKVLEAADMVLRKVPDRLGVMTYLFQLRAYFTREQEHRDCDDVDSVSAADSGDGTADARSAECRQPLDELSVSNCNSVSQKTSTILLLNISVKSQPILIIFDIQNPE